MKKWLEKARGSWASRPYARSASCATAWRVTSAPWLKPATTLTPIPGLDCTGRPGRRDDLAGLLRGTEGWRKQSAPTNSGPPPPDDDRRSSASGAPTAGLVNTPPWAGAKYSPITRCTSLSPRAKGPKSALGQRRQNLHQRQMAQMRCLVSGKCRQPRDARASRFHRAGRCARVLHQDDPPLRREIEPRQHGRRVGAGTRPAVHQHAPVVEAGDPDSGAASPIQQAEQAQAWSSARPWSSENARAKREGELRARSQPHVSGQRIGYPHRQRVEPAGRPLQTPEIKRRALWTSWLAWGTASTRWTRSRAKDSPRWPRPRPSCRCCRNDAPGSALGSRKPKCRRPRRLHPDRLPETRGCLRAGPGTTERPWRAPG